MHIDAVLFDLDGTLWDSVYGVAAAWRQVIAKYPQVRGPVSDEEIAACMGYNMDEISCKLFPNAEERQRRELLDECTAAEHAYLRSHGGRLYPGVDQVLPVLAEKYDLAIVSNCEAGYIECFFDITGLGKYFRDHESFGNTGMEKGDNILTVIKRMGCVSPVYIGDMIKDQLAAEYAGIPYIFAAYGFGQGIRMPQKWSYKADDFFSIPQILEKMGR